MCKTFCKCLICFSKVNVQIERWHSMLESIFTRRETEGWRCRRWHHRIRCMFLSGKISTGIDLSCIILSACIRAHNTCWKVENCAWKLSNLYTRSARTDWHRWFSGIKWRVLSQKKNCLEGGEITPHQSFNLEDIKGIVTFLTNYAALRAMVLAGRVPGFKLDDIKLPPSSHTSVFVYDEYRKSPEGTGRRIVGWSSFRSYWKQLLPFIVTCQKNNTLIYRSANTSEDEKGQSDYFIKLQF